MTARVFVVEPRPLPSRVSVAVPRVFRFADTNPVTGTAYAVSPYSDLPLFAAWVVCGPVNLEPGEWDLIVADGETSDWVELDQPFVMPEHTRFRLDSAGLVHRVDGHGRQVRR